MEAIRLTQWLALAGAAVGALGLLARARSIFNRPRKPDLARERGSERRGVLYAFTLGMAPWEKESTRRHWLAYLRGIGFHLGVFAALGSLAGSPWRALWPTAMVWLAAGLAALGGTAGLVGLPMRWTDANLRRLSLPDDYFAVALTSLFALLAALALLWAPARPAWYASAAVLLAYVPFGKIRHCLYFFYSKFFFGLIYGRRGVLGQSKSRFAE
jgi:hypothetical protein